LTAYDPADRFLRQQGAFEMAWKTPKIAEISLGAEINSYASAGLK
jgi:coenzyme PQQ precursor peptide PqqA